MPDDIIDDLPVTEPVVEQVVEARIDPLDAAIDKAFEASRDDKGRFAPKEPAEAGSDAPAKAEAAETTEAKPAVVQPLEPHPRWSDAEKADFAKLPTEGQKIVLERYRSMEADYTRKSQDVAEFRKSAEPLLQAVQPFQQYLASIEPVIGMKAPDMIRGMLTMEHSLRTGTPDQKVQALSQLASSYGIDLAAMSRGEGAQPNPLIDNLRQTVSQLSQKLNQFEQTTQQQTLDQIKAEVTAFENAKTAEGQPKYPHYPRVRGIMAQLVVQDGGLTLEQAYEQATAPIREAVEAELGARQKTAEQMNSDAVAKAKRASSPRTSGTQPNGAAKPSGLDALLDQNLSNAGFA